MKRTWPTVPLHELLNPVSRPERVDPAATYHVLGAHWYAEGLYTKDVLTGADIRADQVYRVEEGDFVYNRLFGWKGSFAIATKENGGCYVSNEFPCFTVNAERLDGRLLWRYFSVTSVWDQVLSLSTGGTPTSRNRLKEEQLLQMRIPLPPLDEQSRIIAHIEGLSAKIEEARRLRNDAVQEIGALGSSALSKIFDFAPTDTLPRGWHWKALRELLKDHKSGMITGPFGTLLQKSDIQLSGIPVLGIANVQANRFSPGFTDYVTQEKADALSPYRVRKDDIVIARSGTVGRSCLVPGNLDPMPIMSTNLMRLRLDQSQFLARLLCMLFNGSRLVVRHKDEECRGSSRVFFTQKILSRLRLPAPPLPEQRRIVEYLDGLQAKVDSLEKLQEETSKELDALMPSILSKAFSGEL